MIIASLQNKSAGLQFLEILYCIKTFAAYVGDGKRFNNGNEAANYVGPVPRRCAVYNLTVSLLKIDATDARSLAEIKRRRIGYTLSIYFGVATTQMCRIFSKVLLALIFFDHITQMLKLNSCLFEHLD